jgi:hypothetical protein
MVTETPATACTTGRCGIDEECRCDYYSDWRIVWPTQPDEPVGVQLRRRRLAAYRCPRLASGRRDPISRSRW